MGNNAGNVTVRFAVADLEKAREAFTLLGKDGEALLRRLEAAGKTPSRPMQALSVLFSNLRGQATGSAQALGVAGDMLLRFGSVGLVAGAALGGVALLMSGIAERAKGVRDAAAATRQNAEQTRFTSEQYQTLELAMRKAGVQADTARNAIGKFNEERANAANAEGALYDRLREVNPELARQFALARSGAEAFDILARARKQATQNQVVLIDKAAFGKAASEIAAAINSIMTAGGLEALQKKFRETGEILESAIVEAMYRAAKASEEKARKVEKDWDAAATATSRVFAQFFGEKSWDELTGSAARAAREIAEGFVKPQSEAGKLGKEIENLKKRIDALRTGNLSTTDALTMPVGQVADIYLTQLLGRQTVEITRLEAILKDKEAQLAKVESRPPAVARPSPATLPNPAPATPDSAAIDREREYQDLLKQRQQLEGKIHDSFQAMEKNAGNADRVGVFQKRAEDAQAELEKLDDKLEALKGKQKTEPVSVGVDAQITPAEQKISSLKDRIRDLKERIEALGDDRSADKLRIQLRQAQTDLARAQPQPKIDTSQAARINEAFEIQIRAAEMAKRVQLGVATEEERRAQFVRELNLQIAEGRIKESEREEAMRSYNKTLKETIEAEQVRKSNTPQLLQLSQQASNLTKTLDQELASSARGLTSDLTGMAKGTEKAGQGFANMGLKMAEAVANAYLLKTVIGPLTNGLMGISGMLGLGGGYGGFLQGNTGRGYALGGAFHRGYDVAFAGGGIVDRPTLFPMAGGRRGLMGEAGEEAIMPLKRTALGAFGVRALVGGKEILLQLTRMSSGHLGVRVQEGFGFGDIERPPPITRQYALGGAFHRGYDVAFAGGGIVDRPPLFPMAGGRRGLMGEAGEEAIMPLKRTALGAFGVRALVGGKEILLQLTRMSSGHLGVRVQEGFGFGDIERPPPITRQYALGGAFHRGYDVAFAGGGIVDRPPLFPMAGGRRGLMGEAGEEAIMPLKRTALGAFGVRALVGGKEILLQLTRMSSGHLGVRVQEGFGFGDIERPPPITRQYALGGAFHRGYDVAFAGGGIVDRPTLFPMAGGRRGLMGEAGEEAIMPLKRTALGAFGVRALVGGKEILLQLTRMSSGHLGVRVQEGFGFGDIERPPPITRQYALGGAFHRGYDVAFAGGGIVDTPSLTRDREPSVTSMASYEADARPAAKPVPTVQQFIGGGDVEIHIHNAPAGTTVEKTKKTRNANGGFRIEAWFRDQAIAAITNDLADGGEITDAIAARFGLNKAAGLS